MSVHSFLRRGQPFNELIASPAAAFPQTMADLGNYYTALAAAPGTGTNYAVQASYSATAAVLTLQNGGTEPTGAQLPPAPTVVLDWVRLLLTTAPASAVSGQWAITLDNKTRGSSGTAMPPNNCDLGTTIGSAPKASVATAIYTPTVASASASAFVLDRGTMRSVIPVVGDEYIFVFGRGDSPGTVSDIAGTTAKRIVIPCAPVILRPNANMTALLHLWFPSNATTAAAFECAAGWYER